MLHLPESLAALRIFIADTLKGGAKKPELAKAKMYGNVRLRVHWGGAMPQETKYLLIST